MRPDHESADRLRALLREGDPAADGSEPSSHESANLRRVVLRSVRASRQIRWVPLGAATAIAMLAVVLLLPERAPSPARSSEGPSSASVPLPESSEDTASDAPRQIQFATEQGTQIIWVLDPDLDL